MTEETQKPVGGPPETFGGLQAWLQREVTGWSEAANNAVANGELTLEQAKVVYAEKVSLSTAKAVNRLLELLMRPE